ncbi:exonuclease domain-containing protein [Natronospora cellulosivora (SeqCode)]
MKNNNTGIGGFIDVETTGLSNSDEIIEFAICLFEFEWESGKILGVVDRYSGLREANVAINPQAEKVHGINANDIKGESLDIERISELIKKVDFLVSHNVSFDRRFVKKIIHCVEKKRWLCSMKGIDWKRKGFKSKGLQKLLFAHRIFIEQEHRAESDVLASLKLLSCSNGNGKTYLAELLNKIAR